jgi:hypothetical protein
MTTPTPRPALPPISRQSAFSSTAMAPSSTRAHRVPARPLEAAPTIQSSIGATLPLETGW